MNKAKIDHVKIEMARLKERIEILEAEMKGTSLPFSSFPKETGAMRRASMDLTRALADLRRKDIRL